MGQRGVFLFGISAVTLGAVFFVINVLDPQGGGHKARFLPPVALLLLGSGLLAYANRQDRE